MTMQPQRMTILRICLPVIVIGLLLVLMCQPASGDEPSLAAHEGYHGIWLRSEAIEAFVGLQPQFRILSIRRRGDASLMAGQDAPHQGLRLAFMEPQQIAASFDVGNVPAELIEHADTFARVQLQPGAGLRYAVSLSLHDSPPKVQITYELTNVSETERRIAPWSLIAYARDGLIVTPFGRQALVRRRLVLPWWGEWPQPGVQIGRHALMTNASAPLNGQAYKIGVITDAGWVAFVRGERCLVSRIAFQADARYPEDGANITIFHLANDSRSWCETEQVGPLQTLQPGESATVTETIECLTIEPPADPTPDALRAAVEAAQSRLADHP